MKTGNEEINNEVDDDLKEDPSMREVMEEALEEIEEIDAGEPGDKEEITAKSAEAEPKAKEGEHVEKTPKVEAKEKKGIADVDIKPGAEEGKAPQSWSPKLREEFGKLSPTVQAQINKRETEMNKSLNEGAESRKLGESVRSAVEPFKAVMAADGFSDPMQAITGLMQTAAQLRMGTPQQKAERLAQLIQHYGVDIGTLDTVLSGAAPAAQSPDATMQAMIAKEMAPFKQFIDNSQQNTQNNAQTQVSDFEGKAEFISDVRLDMADLMDMAAKRGQSMTLQQAYDKACAINPEINGLLQQRAADDKIKNSKQTIKQKRYASSSISGHQVGTNESGGSGSIEDTLNQAWDDQMRS